MRTKIQYIFMLAATALLAGCMNEQEPFNTPSGEGTFALSLNKGEIVVNAETRAALSATDAANYNIMVYQNDYELWSQKKKYSALTGSDTLSLPRAVPKRKPRPAMTVLAASALPEGRWLLPSNRQSKQRLQSTAQPPTADFAWSSTRASPTSLANMM